MLHVKKTEGPRAHRWLPALAAVFLLATATRHALAEGGVTTAPANTLDTGDTAWMLISAALVMLMVPGLALFYGGMVRRKNILATMMHSIAVLGLVGVEWFLIGYPMVFGKDHGGLIGWDSGKALLWNVLPGDLYPHTRVPEYVHAMYQGMFAIITPALIAGAFAERVKFKSYAVFAILWGVIVYNPVAHWIWGGGWMGTDYAGFHLGALDFAGGIVVHVTAGVSALVMALYIGKRIGFPHGVLQPNSLALTLLGAGLLWFGWFGFNGGSAGGANAVAGLAFTTTQIAAAGGAVAWLVAEWFKHGKPTSLGVASGLVAGLATITPCAGYVSPAAALLIGMTAGVVCYSAVVLKGKFGYDDSLDAFGVHGVGGFMGAVLLGVFAQKLFNNDGANGLITGSPNQLGSQAAAAGIAAAYAAIATLVITVLIDKTMGFRVKSKHEVEGLDPAIHGEQGWMLDQLPEPTVGMPGDQSIDNTAPVEEREINVVSARPLIKN